MKGTLILLLLISLVFLDLSSTASADKSYRIHSPRGGLITLVISSGALKKIRIHDLAFSDNGDVFIITAAPFLSKDEIQTMLIDFYNGLMSVQSEYVDVGPGKTLQELYCPEAFDRIVVDSSGY